MRKSRVILGFAVFVLFNYVSVFAEGFTSSKEEALVLAFKEEAIRGAFQEAEISALSQNAEESREFPNLLSYLHPYFNAGVIYNDNIWDVHDNVQSDLYLDVTPGVKFTFGDFEEAYTDKLQQSLDLDLGARIVHSFLRDVDLNREAPFVGLNYQLEGGRNKIRLGNYFKKGYELQSQLAADLRGLAGYVAMDSDIGWEYSFNRLGLGLGYKRTAYNYYKDFKASNTFENNMGIITGFFRITPKTRVFLEYNYGQYDYTKSSTSAKDYNYNKFWVGGHGNFTKKLSGLAKIGYQNTEYFIGTVKNTMTIDSMLTYKQSLKNTFFLNFFCGDLTTGYSDQGLDHKTSLTLGFLHNFNRRLGLKGDFSLVKDNYETGRDDNAYLYSLSFDYAFRKWMKISLGYAYIDRISTDVTASYKSNKFSLMTKVEF